MLDNSEIEEAIEMYVNCIYDGASDWLEASKEEWINAVWNELSDWKWKCGKGDKSHENRFYGKKNVTARISELLDKTFERLRNEGYDVKVN